MKWKIVSTFLVGLAAVALLLVPAIALAHAQVATCTPPVNGTVATAPATLTCKTAEAMVPQSSSLKVYNAAGTAVDKGDSAVDLNDPDRETIAVSLDPSKMQDGVYTVKWATLSADDGDAADGTFTFTVGAAAAPTTPPATSSSSGSSSAATPAAVAAPVTQADAEKYCTDNKGTVVTRTPAYNTNADSSQWLRLGGPMEFCTFYAPADSTGFQSQISIALSTLLSDQPTLAVLAYLEPVDLPPFTGANPSTLYCSKLGGADVWGGQNNAAGGGWVTDAPDSATNFQVVDMCVFPDMSAIDAWGLTYKANGVVRGMDLTKLVKYQPTALPPVFVSDSSPNEPALEGIDQTLNEEDNGSSTDLDLGDALSIELPSNPSTGYSWQISKNDKTVLLPIGDSQFSLGNETPVPGAGGTQTFLFKAVGKGTDTLSLIYVRPWEKNVTPTPNDVYTVTVTVQ